MLRKGVYSKNNCKITLLKFSTLHFGTIGKFCGLSLEWDPQLKSSSCSLKVMLFLFVNLTDS